MITRETVAEELNEIAERFGRDVRWIDAMRLAHNLSNYGARFEGVEPEELVPHITAWKRGI